MEKLSEHAQGAPLTRQEEKRKRAILDAVRAGDVASLRREATEGRGGLLNAECRQKAWPLLAGVDESLAPAITAEMVESFSHPEERQVGLDLDRSLHVIKDNARRDDCRESLKRMILAALTDYGSIHGDNERTRWYYQGLHDISAVLLITVGERLGAAVLNNLLCWHLKPWMEGGSGKMREVLGVIQPLLEKADPELAGVLNETLISDGMGSDYALPWLITWLTHTYSNELDVCARLVDLCLASPPIIVVYLAVSVASSRKKAVFEHDESAMHYAMLSRLPPNPPIHDWVEKAVMLHRKVPPEKLMGIAFGPNPPPVLDPEVSPLFFLPESLLDLHAQLAQLEARFAERRAAWERGERRPVYQPGMSWLGGAVRSATGVTPEGCAVMAAGLLLSVISLAATQRHLLLDMQQE